MNEPGSPLSWILLSGFPLGMLSMLSLETMKIVNGLPKLEID